MNLITENPYRVLGLLVGATAAQQNRQITRLRKYIEAEQEPESDFSFSSLGELKRTVVSIDAAASKLNLDADRMLAAIFWFYEGNSITDEPAFDALKEGDTDEAIGIWRKLAINDDTDTFNPITKRNASAFHNLSTYYLEENGIDEETLRLKLLFIESDFFKDLVGKATDETFKITNVDAQILFLNNLIQTKDTDPSDLIDVISEIDFIAKEDFLKSVIQIPIQEIEQNIELSRSKRKANKSDAFTIGGKLLKDSKEKLKLIENALGKSNIKYVTISDKLSDEILQCGIDYFSYYRDSDKDPGENTMKIFRAAKSLALGNIAKQRCKENTENLQEWIDNASERNAHIQAKQELDSLIRIFQEYDNKYETVQNAKTFINKCSPLLSSIRLKLGHTDDLVIKLTERVANQTLSYVIDEINERQEVFSKRMKTYDPNMKMVLNLDMGSIQYESGTKLVSEFKDFVYEAIQVLKLIETIKADEKFIRERFQPNFNAIKKLHTELGQIYTTISNAPSAFDRKQPANSGGGCYIATMAYGDYNHPQVLVLRKFRDEKLSKSAFGRGFIKTYYRYSPMLVEKLKNYDWINRSIRKILNLIIQLIK